MKLYNKYLKYALKLELYGRLGGKMSIIGPREAWAVFDISLFGVKKRDIGPESACF